MDVKEIGIKITERRKELEITQDLLSELSGISKNTVYKVERGQANPSIKILNQIFDILGLEFLVQVIKPNSL